jgi:hypothetical protein
MKKIYALLLAFGFALQSCVNNTDESPTEVIMPENVSYANEVQPIFNQSCGGSACHVGGSASGADLSSYSATMSSQGIQYANLVVAGDADASGLVDKIEPSPQSGSRMPLGAPALSNEEILIIRTWVDEGARDN